MPCLNGAGLANVLVVTGRLCLFVCSDTKGRRCVTSFGLAVVCVSNEAEQRYGRRNYFTVLLSMI